MEEFVWNKLKTGDSKFLNPLINGLELARPEVFVANELTEAPTRHDFNGLFTLKGKLGKRTVGVLYNDFKIKGGSFGAENCRRLIAYLKYCGDRNIPIVFLLSSFGVRMMEGRTVFKDAFATLPAFREYCANNTLITMTTGRCLGIGAVFFGLGDYRIALEKETVLNLTGPEVFKLFFGEKVDYKTCSTAKRNHEKSGIVHHIADSKPSAYKLIRSLLNCQDKSEILIPTLAADRSTLPKRIPIENVLAQIADEYVEVFPHDDQTFRTFVAKKKGKVFGALINTPGRPNMIKVDTLKRYQKAFRLFGKLGLPVLSVVDTPGADPRIEENDKGIIGELINACMDIMGYPFPRKGIIAGRCFGGASVLVCPNFMGGQDVLAINGSNAGVMNEKIIAHLLSATPRLKEEWEQNNKKQQSGLHDLVDVGLIEKIIEWEEVSGRIDKYLTDAYAGKLTSTLGVKPQKASDNGPIIGDPSKSL